MSRNSLTRAHHFLRDMKHLARANGSKSYSQYAEDSAIFSLFNVQPGGFYVDVGAHYPREGSNTFRLYRNGWSGITIEPNREHADFFRALRPRDVHLSLGVSAKSEELSYYKFENSVLNTFSEIQAREVISEGKALIETAKVLTEPLHKILISHAPGRKIDFVNVDCEGFDLEVLKTMDFDRFMPTAICVEDFEAFQSFKDGRGASEINQYLSRLGFAPVAQLMLSTVYVNKKWRQINSPALRPRQESLFP